jgi:hypothetical protein
LENSGPVETLAAAARSCDAGGHIASLATEADDQGGSKH